MTQTRQQRHFRKTIEALGLAAPFAMASRYPDGLAHCVEASICGAAALAKKKIKARAVPCAIVGVAQDRTRHVSLGLNARDVYDRLTFDDGPPLSFAEWSADKQLPEDDCPTHMAIEARYHGERAVVDLTVGQLRQAHDIEAPACVHYFASGWMGFDVPGWTLQHIDSPHAEEIRRRTHRFTANGLVDDLEALMDIALRCDLNVDLFFGALQRAQPAEFRIASARLARFAQKGVADSGPRTA